MTDEIPEPTGYDVAVLVDSPNSTDPDRVRYVFERRGGDRPWFDLSGRYETTPWHSWDQVVGLGDVIVLTPEVATRADERARIVADLRAAAETAREVRDWDRTDAYERAASFVQSGGAS